MTQNPPPKRNPDATKEALLHAARSAFQRAGYDGASTRQIAAEAGCNAALINRYFGGKLGLFKAVMSACLDLSPLAALPPDQLPEALAGMALAKAGRREGFDPMVAAIKSSDTPELAALIGAQLGNPMVAELAALIGGPDAPQKAGLILSTISGLSVGRGSIGAAALGPEAEDRLRPLLRASFQAILSA